MPENAQNPAGQNTNEATGKPTEVARSNSDVAKQAKQYVPEILSEVPEEQRSGETEAAEPSGADGVNPAEGPGGKRASNIKDLQKLHEG
jgi:hypothetical protein